MEPWRQRLWDRGRVDESRELGAGSWELGAGSRELGARKQEAGEVRMFNHWATGLRSGLLPAGCGVATPKSVQKRTKFERSFREGFDF